MAFEKFVKVTKLLNDGYSQPSGPDLWEAYMEISKAHQELAEAVTARARAIGGVVADETHQKFGDHDGEVEFDFDKQEVCVESTIYAGGGDYDSYSIFFPMKLMALSDTDVEARRQAMAERAAREREEQHLRDEENRRLNAIQTEKREREMLATLQLKYKVK